MRHLCAVERPTTTIGADGTPVTTWAHHTTLRAAVMEQSTAESVGAQGATERRVVVFQTRCTNLSASVTNADRIQWEGHALNIRSIEPDAQLRRLTIKTETEVTP